MASYFLTPFGAGRGLMGRGDPFAELHREMNRLFDDVLRGGAGNDRIAVRDGERDVVNCGPGIDRALLDFKDVTEDNSCEVVARRRPNRADSRVEDRNEGDQP